MLRTCMGTGAMHEDPPGSLEHHDDHIQVMDLEAGPGTQATPTPGEPLQSPTTRATV